MEEKDGRKDNTQMLVNCWSLTSLFSTNVTISETTIPNY